MIPIVGPILSAMPAIAVAFTVSPTLALGVAVFFFAQQQLENHVLVPKVMSAAGRHQPGVRDRRAAHRRIAARHRRRDPRGPDRGDPAGAASRKLMPDAARPTDERARRGTPACGRCIRRHRRSSRRGRSPAGLGRDVAWDLGDSVLNMWILSWDCEQLRGDPRRRSLAICGTSSTPTSFIPRR